MSPTPHTLLDPQGLGPASGFSHGVAAVAGRTVYVAGQVGCDDTGVVASPEMAAQLDVALDRIVRVLAAAGGRPEDVVSMTLHTTSMAQYRAQRADIGRVYRTHFGRHFPAMTMVAVQELVNPDAVIEVTAVAVVPDARRSSTE